MRARKGERRGTARLDDEVILHLMRAASAAKVRLSEKLTLLGERGGCGMGRKLGQRGKGQEIVRGGRRRLRVIVGNIGGIERL